MAGGGDVSACLEVTDTYGNLLKFNSGKFGIAFDGTGDDELVWAKDPTADVTDAVLYIDYIQLAACGTGAAGHVAICDGSEGEAIVSLATHDGTLGSGNEGTWDFKDDPLVCLTAESTQSLCVSAAASAQFTGFIKCWWGVI